MKISGGKLKGRRVPFKKENFIKSKTDELRPTSAKVREAIFDILQYEIEDSVFLDLYSGTGAVGLEALSRGAARVILVENNTVRSKAIMNYIKEIGVKEKAVIYREKVEYFLKRAIVAGATFDIIFADPPYSSHEMIKTLNVLNEHDVLREGGSLLVVHSSKMSLPSEFRFLRFIKQYKYGDTMLTLYRKEK